MSSKISHGSDAFIKRIKDWQAKKTQWEDIFSFKSIPTESTLIELETSWDDFLNITKALLKRTESARVYGGLPGVNMLELQHEASTFLKSATIFLMVKPHQI